MRDPKSGEVIFNVVGGGYLSIKRNVMSIPFNFSVTQAQLMPFTEALLRVFRYVCCNEVVESREV